MQRIFRIFILLLVLPLAACAINGKEVFEKQNKAVQYLMNSSFGAQMDGDEHKLAELEKAESALTNACRAIQKEAERRSDGEDASPWYSLTALEIMLSLPTCEEQADLILRKPAQKPFRQEKIPKPETLPETAKEPYAGS